MPRKGSLTLLPRDVADRVLRYRNASSWRAGRLLRAGLLPCAILPTLSAVAQEPLEESSQEPAPWSEAEESMRWNAAGTPVTRQPGGLLGLDFENDNLSGRGLLDFQDPFPLALLHLQMPFNTMEALPKGEGKLEIDFFWGNSFVLEDAFSVDVETYKLEFGGWYALRDDFYVGAELPLVARGPGILDPVVESFHESFSLGNDDRDQRDRGEYEFVITDEDGRDHVLNRGVGFGDFNLKTHWILNHGGPYLPAVNLQTVVALPSSTSGFGSDGVDLGVSMSFHKTLLKRLQAHVMIGGTYLTTSSIEGIDFQRWNFQLAGGGEFVITDWLSIVFQGMLYSPLLENPEPLDKIRKYVAGGLKFELFPDVQFELSVIENLAPLENSSDIAVVFGFDIRL